MTGELPAVSDEVYKEGRLPLLELPSVAALAEDVGLDVLAAVVVRDRRDFVAALAEDVGLDALAAVVVHDRSDFVDLVFLLIFFAMGFSASVLFFTSMRTIDLRASKSSRRKHWCIHAPFRPIRKP